MVNVEESRSEQVPVARVPASELGRDLVVLSHLRWDFVFQRPQHLLTRFAREQRVFFVEEPHFGAEAPWWEILMREKGVRLCVPHLPHGLDDAQRERALAGLVDALLAEHDIRDYLLWYYTPMALGFSAHLRPRAIVYDCMDELASFAFAPPELKAREAELMRRADIVFTGGQSLYEAKRGRHPRVHVFPSSVDVAHFAQARSLTPEPPDQAAIPGPRLGFFGVIDERMDLELLRAIAERRPAWHLVLLGPICKISPASLPRLTNIHYLGGKPYADLPRYLAGWDVALLPFARNESTRFISPTKTPEYLAAGKPVVSTSIRDVVRPYGEMGLVRIADTPDEFVAAVEAALAETNDRGDWLDKVDGFLAQTSWDHTWERMKRLMKAAVHAGGDHDRPQLN